MKTEKTIEIKLGTPITAHGEQVEVLKMRAPTTGDLIDLGPPILVVTSTRGGSSGIEVRQDVLANYICKLAAIPMSAVRSLSMSDFSLASAEVMRFFDPSKPAEAPQA